MTDFHKNARKNFIEILATESFLDNPATQVRKIKVNIGLHVYIVKGIIENVFIGDNYYN